MEAPVLDIEEQTGQGDPLGILSKKKTVAPVQKADPLNILSQPKQTAPAQTPAPTQQSFPAYDARNLIAPVARESTQGPVINAPTTTNKTSADIHTEKLQQARNNLVTNFNEHSDQAIRKIVSKNIEDEFKKLGSAFQDGQIDEKTFKTQQNALFQRMINTSQEVNQYKQDMSQDPTKVRQVVHTIADTHPDKAPQLQSDMYLLDAQNRPQKANKIVFNANKMQKGEMNYDIKNGIVKRPEGFFESLGSGLKERNRMMKDYDFYQGKSDKDVIGKLELERAKFDPDEPVAAPSGISGHIGGAIGSQGIVTAKGAGAATLTSMIPVAGEAAAPWMAAAVTSPEFYKTGWVSSLERNYHEFRNKGLAPQEALNKAKDRADFDAKVDVAQGIVSTALGTKMGLKAVGSVGGELSPTFQNTIKNIALKSGKWLGETSLEGGANAMIAGGMQELKNIHSGRPTGEGAIQAGMGQLMFSYGLGALTKAGKALLTPTAHRTILNEMSRAPEEQVNNTLGQLVNDGTITPEDATDVHDQIQNHKELSGKIPDEITDSKTRDKVQELIDKRTSLEQKLETVDKAFHPGIKEQIDKVNEQITTTSKKGTKSDKEEEPETFKSPIDRAKELINQDVVKGFSAEPLKEAAKEESGQKLEGMLRDIAQQAHDPATEGATIETYGPELVKISKEIHPEHFINEHKVTMPEPEKSVTEGAEINPSGVSGAAPSVQTTDVFRTLDYGDNKGKEENAAAQDKIKEQILSNEPIGNTGEKFGDFVNRVIPAFKETLKNEPHNTTIVTHSSVIKALRVWEEMGRPEVNDKNIREFAEKYVNLKPEKEGEVHTLKGEDGKEIKVVRHGETEDNKLSEFRQDDTKLTDKGIAQAGKAGDNLLKETGGNIPKIISSDLPRTQHTSEIINNKLKENALPIESAGSVLQHPQEGIGREGSGRERVEPSQQGEEPAGEGKPVGNTEEENKGQSEEKVEDGLPFGRLPVGIAHHLQEDRARAELNVLPPERGEGITLEQSIKRGKELIDAGTNPDQVTADFKKDKRLNADDMAVVRARYNELAQKTNKAYDTYGEGSPEAKAAFTAERSWYNDAVKPMQTEWSKIGVAQQSAIDLDTGSITGIKRAFSEAKGGGDLTAAESKKATEFHDKIKEKDDVISKLQSKIDNLINKQKEAAPEKGIKEKAKDLAKKIRDNAKLSRPGMFSAASPGSIVWDGAVEVVASSIEAGGAIADAIAKGIEHIKASDWYNNLSKKEKENAINQFEEWHKSESTDKIDIQTHFADKKGNKFTQEEVKAIWEHAKAIISSGKTDFHDVVQQVAMDTGLSADQVRHAISQPKGAKKVTDEMYAEMYKRNQIVQQAKIWVKSANQSATKKFFNKVVKVPSAIVTFGHGSVAPITHVGADLYRPSNWRSYFNFMLDSYKFSFGGLTKAGKARYEQAMADLVRDPLYIPAKRAGLKIDPTNMNADDYSKYQGVFGRLAKMGERGFNAMKPYRLEQFRKIYNGLSDQAKADPDVVKSIAQMVNLSSGTTNAKIPENADLAFFAPKLVTSQYQRIFSEPTKAVSTFANWKNASTAERIQAKMVARHAGEMVSTYLGLLAANQAILGLTGSTQSINFTNPLDADWMKFKVLGKSVDASGGMNSALRFVGSLIEEGLRANGIVETPEKSKPGDTERRKIIQQLTNKLSPAAGDLAELFSGTDMMGNPLPWSSVKPAKGKEALTWDEYLTTKLPIPLAEGIKTFTESAKENGMPEAKLNDYLQGTIVGILTGTTGAKISPEYKKETKSGGSGGGAGAGGNYGGYSRYQ